MILARVDCLGEDLQALPAAMATDELDGRVRHPLRGEPRQHLVPEQMGMNPLGDASFWRVLLDVLRSSAEGRLRCPIGRGTSSSRL
jgi:hypothetical protein